MAAPAANESAVECTEMDHGEVQENNGAMFCEGQLSFLGHEVKEIPLELIADYADRTARLDLSFNQLQSLQGLEKFTQLTELIVDNNELSEDVAFPKMASLSTLCLNKNRIVDLDPLLRQLKVKAPRLHYLSLLGNAACPNQLSSSDKDDEDYQRYRYYVLFHLPHLRFLDSSAVRGTELQEAKRRRQFLQVVRPPHPPHPPSQVEGGDPQCPYTPLSSDPLPDGQGHHLGFYSKATCDYIGRESEGNRFIRSKDL